MKSVEMDVRAPLNTVSYHRLTDEQLMAIAAQSLSAIKGHCETVQEPLELVDEK